MSSVVCSQCGYVRWDSTLRCPNCGAEARDLRAPNLGIRRTRPTTRRGAFIDASGREVDTQDKPNPAPSTRRRSVAAAAAAGLVVVVVLIYFITSGAASPEILIQEGEVTAVPQGGAWAIATGGTLQGSFSVVNGSAEVCFASYDMFDYAWAHGLNFSQCPSNATYSSGFVASGALSGSFGQGNVYLQTFVPPGWSQAQPRPSIVWTTTAEIQPG